MNRRLHFPVLLVGCFLYGAFVVPHSNAATPKPKHGIGTALLVKLAPPVPCTSKNRMDVFIDEDNIMWECVCEILQRINICRWQVIGGVDAVALRRQLKRHHVIRGRLLVTYVKPGVVG